MPAVAGNVYLFGGRDRQHGIRHCWKYDRKRDEVRADRCFSFALSRLVSLLRSLSISLSFFPFLSSSLSVSLAPLTSLCHLSSTAAERYCARAALRWVVVRCGAVRAAVHSPRTASHARDGGIAFA